MLIFAVNQIACILITIIHIIIYNLSKRSTVFLKLIKVIEDTYIKVTL